MGAVKFTGPLQRPPETAISTSAISIGYPILAEDFSFYIRCLFTAVEWVEISQKIFAIFFGPRMFVRS